MVGLESTMGPMSTPEDLDRALADPTEWGPPAKGVRKSEKRQRSAVVSVRMTETELAAVQDKARRRGQTIGAYMRETALASQPQPHSAGLRLLITTSGGPRNELEVLSTSPVIYCLGRTVAALSG